MPERVVIPAARGQAACATVLQVRLCRVERVEYRRRYFARVDGEVSAEIRHRRSCLPASQAVNMCLVCRLFHVVVFLACLLTREPLFGCLVGSERTAFFSSKSTNVLVVAAAVVVIDAV